MSSSVKKMENCLKHIPVDNIEETLQTTKPCTIHGSPWRCAFVHSNRPIAALKILSKLNITIWDSNAPTEEKGWCVLPIDHFGYKATALAEKNSNCSVSVLLSAYKIMLETMMRQNETRLPIPKHVIWIIWDLFGQMLDEQYYDFVDDPINATVNRKPLSFLLNALHLALSAGANINEKSCICGCVFPDKVGYDQDVGFLLKPFCFPNLVKPVNSNGVDYSVNPIIFAKIAEFYEILFVHGNKPDRTWLTFVSQIVSLQKAELFKLGGISLSLMDHDDWQEAQSKLSILHKRAVRSIPQNAEEQETKSRKLKLIETYQEPKSLQSLCRKVLYDNVPQRRMVRYVDHLPLTVTTKQYLLFKSDEFQI